MKMIPNNANMNYIEYDTFLMQSLFWLRTGEQYHITSQYSTQTLQYVQIQKVSTHIYVE